MKSNAQNKNTFIKYTFEQQKDFIKRVLNEQGKPEDIIPKNTWNKYSKGVGVKVRCFRVLQIYGYVSFISCVMLNGRQSSR